ncbi:MAG: DegT/DnrJ/EryC1/StrS family aminotransferase [Treponema sp.]|jgi:dTDP-4-amino-4,6-dideoxygalactose transaminase|nr:DegT/DnrJ/EryC1/StrS family aminotransferase [Treponema sp.]
MANDDIPFAKPFTGTEEEDAVIRVLRSGWLTTGIEALNFEKEFAEFLKRPPLLKTGSLHCLAVNSATSGLHLALEACGIGPGDAVLVPSCTFTATAEVARYLGADPVFVDVSPGAFHIDPAALENTLLKLPSGKARAVIPVHYGGLPCDMEAIMDIARRYGLKVIEDAAHAFPSAIAGTTGDIGVFSFYATKTITTGEGGMIVCGDEAIARRIALMRIHGIDRTIWNRYSDARASWYYEVAEAGYKYNLPDLLAAIGRVQLARAWELLRMRETIAAAYDSAFCGNECLLLPPTGSDDARHLYPLRLNPLHLRISRDEFIQKLKEAGIGVSVHFIPLHTMPFYKNRYHLTEEDFPETMKSCRQEISLPIWPGMSNAQVDRVIETVLSISGNFTG